MFAGLKSALVAAMTAIGFGNSKDAIPVSAPAPTSSPLERAYGPRSMFPARRSYALPDFVPPKFWFVPTYGGGGGGPAVIAAATAKRARRAAKWAADCAATARGRA